MMKTIGLIVAVEIGAVKTLFGEPISITKECGFDVYVHKRHDLRLVVIHCGMGTIASSGATTLALVKYGAEIIVNFGLVGALTEEMAVQSVALVETVKDSEMDVCNLLNIPKGQHEGFEHPYLKLDEELLSLASEVAPALPRVTIVSGNQFLVGEAKRKAREEYQGDICDMEIAGIAYTAKRANVPVLCLKIVSDSLLGGAEEFYEALERASLECLKILDGILAKL